MKTTDLADAYAERVRVAAPGWQDFGGVVEFGGAVHLLEVFEDNTLVRAALEQPGRGRVLVVDGGGSLRCALLGGNLAKLAADNGWAGVVVNGCVRDRQEIAICRVGVKAIATHPKRSEKNGAGSEGGSVRFAGIEISPGDWLYADEDGFLVATAELAAPCR